MATRGRTRTRLLDAADELFFTQGITHTPVDAVLERAGVSPATMYRAYGSKESLLAAALERRHDEWLAAWDTAIERSGDDRGRLLAVFDALDQFRMRPGGARWCAFLGTAAEFAEPPPEVSAALAVETSALRERLHTLAIPVAGSAADALADALVLIVSGQLAMRLRPVDPEAARTTAQVMVDHYSSPAQPKGAAAQPGVN